MLVKPRSTISQSGRLNEIRKLSPCKYWVKWRRKQYFHKPLESRKAPKHHGQGYVSDAFSTNNFYNFLPKRMKFFYNTCIVALCLKLATIMLFLLRQQGLPVIVSLTIQQLYCAQEGKGITFLPSVTWSSRMTIIRSLQDVLSHWLPAPQNLEVQGFVMLLHDAE